MAKKKSLISAEELQNAYVDYVLTQGHMPKSVYVFAKENGMSEEEFYTHFGSFEGIEQSIWTDLCRKALTEVENQEIWSQYSSREKALAFFYALIELLKSKRSFVLYSLKQSGPKIGSPSVLKGVKTIFEDFATGIINQGL